MRHLLSLACVAAAAGKAAPACPVGSCSRAKLKKALLEDYDPVDIAPNAEAGASRPDVYFGFSVHQLLKFEYEENYVRIVAWFRLMWYDEGLAYSGADHFASFSPNFERYQAGDCAAKGCPVATECPAGATTDTAGNCKQGDDSLCDCGDFGSMALSQPWDIEKDFLPFKPDEVWVPDVRLTNAVEFNWGENCDDTEVQVYDKAHTAMDGGQPVKFNVFYSRPCTFNFKCAVSMTDFPFDAHHCKMTFEPWVDNMIRFRVLKDLVADSTVTKTYEVIILEPQESTVTYAGNGHARWPIIKVPVVLRRFAHYYIVNFIIPLLCMILMAWITFWIPLESMERIAYATTMLLSVIATNFITADKRPATSGSMWLDYFQNACFLAALFPVIETIVLHRLMSLDEETRKLLKSKFHQIALQRRKTRAEDGQPAELEEPLTPRIGLSIQLDNVLIDNVDRFVRIVYPVGFGSYLSFLLFQVDVYRTDVGCSDPAVLCDSRFAKDEAKNVDLTTNLDLKGFEETKYIGITILIFIGLLFSLSVLLLFHRGRICVTKMLNGIQQKIGIPDVDEQVVDSYFVSEDSDE